MPLFIKDRNRVERIRAKCRKDLLHIAILSVLPFINLDVAGVSRTSQIVDDQLPQVRYCLIFVVFCT